MTSSPLDFSLKALITADHAEVVNGKLYLNGGCWTRLAFPSFPHVLPAMAVVAVLEVPYGRYNSDHTFLLTLEDPDGQWLPVRAEGNFRIDPAASTEVGEATVMPIAVPIHNLVLNQAGNYAFVFSVDGDELDRYNVRATQVQMPQQ